MKATPRVMARLAGGLYLVSAVPAGFSVWVFLKLVVRGDPAATAANILGSEALFRFGFVADLIGIMLVLGSTLVLYELFKPVSGSMSLLMAFFCLMGSAIQAVDSLGDMAALVLLKGGSSMSALTTAQSQALAFLFLRLHNLLYDLALVFFGVFVFLIGWLVRRSPFLPRILGILLAIDGLAISPSASRSSFRHRSAPACSRTSRSGPRCWARRRSCCGSS